MTEQINYETVMNAYKKHFHITHEDEQAIDLILSIAITRKEPTRPTWLIMIAPSGGNKTGLITPLHDNSEYSTTVLMSKITPNTFLSGRVNKDNTKDFAYYLQDNPKLFLTPDFAQFLKLKAEVKQEIWSQLRDLYDGFIERKAAGVKKKATNIKFNWIICSTHAVDSELLIHSELGTRELLFRFNEEVEKATEEKQEDEDLMQVVWSNSEKEKEIQKEIGLKVRQFIESKENKPTEEIKISEKIKEKIMQTALTITKLRAAAESDSYTGDLNNFVHPERPTRILLQLKSIFIGLKKLDENYSDEKAIKVIEKLALSSIHPIRLKIILKIMERSEMTTTQIQKSLGIGWKTINTQLWTAWQLGIVKYMEKDESSQTERTKKEWYANNDSPVIKYLKEANLLEEDWKGLNKIYRKKQNDKQQETNEDLPT